MDKFTIWFVIIIFIIAVVSILMYINFMIMKHIKRIKGYREAYKEQFGDDKISLFDALLGRCRNYISNYIIFQAVGKSFEILSVAFSVCSFAVTGFKLKTDYTPMVISLISMIFVILTIYIVPRKRYQQYLHAWRESDEYIMKVLSRTMTIEDALQQISAIEQSITTDED